MKKQMLKSVKSIPLKTNLQATCVYPKNPSKVKTLEELKSVGITFNREQALAFANNILLAATHWDNINVTAYRKNNRVTVTTSTTTTITKPSPPSIFSLSHQQFNDVNELLE
jgi:hypothetical protein